MPYRGLDLVVLPKIFAYRLSLGRGFNDNKSFRHLFSLFSPIRLACSVFKLPLLCQAAVKILLSHARKITFEHVLKCC